MRFFSTSSFSIIGGIVAGVLTAIHALGTMGLRPAIDGVGWQEWRLDENDRLRPYSLGHFLGSGQLPPPKAARFYVRETDDDGNVLSSDCVFKISGPAIPSRWWSLSVGQNESSILSAGQAILDGEGNLKAVVSRHPLPGNWLTPPDSSHFTLTYIISEPAKLKATENLVLPQVKKAGC
jgi:hypothetical protein